MATASPATRPFRFSLQAAQAQSRQEWIDLVKRADDAGFDMIVTADHLEQCLAPLIPLATAAEVSERLRLGIMVLNNDLHHPPCSVSCYLPLFDSKKLAAIKDE